MNFQKIQDAEAAAKLVAGRVREQLEAGKKVFWLVSGGSCIEVAVNTARQLQPADHLDNLTVGLVDERYGPVGHADSNYRQLMAAGFKLPGVNVQPVLSGKSLPATTDAFETFLKAGLESGDYALALAGMGADGHTFGILPHSPAVDSSRLAEAYEAPDFTRITATPKFIARLNEVILYAVGENKHQALHNLKEPLSVAEHPAQALKRVPKFTILSDKGDSA